MKFPTRRPRMRWLALALALAMALAHQFAAAAPPPWPEVSFTYIAAKDTLSKVLAGFGQTFGLQVDTTAAVQAQDAAVDGKLTAATPSEFLNQLGATYGLSWYYRSGVLYVSRTSESVTRALPLASPGGAALKAALGELGVLDAKFGWGELAERGLVLVAGPPSYVDLVAQTVSALPSPAATQQVKVFRLAHAPVDDRTIQYRDKQITTAGAATILRNLVSGESGRSGTTTQLVELAQPLRSRLAPLASIGAASDDDAPQATPPKDAASVPAANAANAANAASQRAVIQADSRLNALIIKDRPDRMPIYEQLIHILDVPSKLIEIEAVIVDVNTTKMTELGIDWGASAGKNALGFGQPNQAPDPTTLSLMHGSGAAPAALVAGAGRYLMARITALQSSGDARIVSTPSVLTLDNLGALIDLSETFYIQSTGERVAQVTPISVGVTLRVTPHLIEQPGTRAVNLIVDIEDGAIQDLQVQNLPTVRRSTIGTQAVVAEDASLLIGGFNSESNVRQKDSVPLLGDLPVVGALFSKNKTDGQKRERLFLITPRVVPQPVLATAAPEEPRK